MKSKHLFLKAIAIITAKLFICITFVSCSNTKGRLNSVEEDSLFFPKERHINVGKHNRAEEDIAPFEFTFYNKGDSIIHIDNIDITCGCVVLTTIPNHIAPLCEEKLKGHLNLKMLNGSFRKTIFVNYNDTKVQILSIKGTVIDSTD